MRGMGRSFYFLDAYAPALVRHYALLNPHSAFAYEAGEASVEYPPHDLAWAKWTPNAPTSPWWYTHAQFKTLLGAFLSRDRDNGGARLISTVLEEFDGFKGSAARTDVLRPLGLARATLEALVDGEDLDPALVAQLLSTMQARARPVAPKYLGVLDKPHLCEALASWYAVDPATLTYRAVKAVTDDVPYVLEVVCGWTETSDVERTLLGGFNFTPALDVPFRDLYTYCATADVTDDDPVTLMVHVTCPRLTPTDRGKGAVTLPDDVRAAMQTLVAKVTAPWAKLKAKVRRAGKQRALHEARERRQHRPMDTKTAAWQVMEAAYLKASNQGRLPANARQIMYAARPEILRLTGKEQPWKNSQYFTQTLLPDFMEAHPDLTANWDVVFDARGHFREPHTAYEFGLGTLEVRRYLSLWTRRLRASVEVPTLPHTINTWGPTFRYHYALFVEKEGFDALLARAQIQDRYDVALMSTKGMTVTAARRLIEALSQAGVTILVVHDFDKSGFEILHKFTADTRRYHYTVPPTVLDLGLRLEEALAMGLASEPVPYDTQRDPRGESPGVWGDRDGMCLSGDGAQGRHPQWETARVLGRAAHRTQRHGLAAVPGLARTQAPGRGGRESRAGRGCPGGGVSPVAAGGEDGAGAQGGDGGARGRDARPRGVGGADSRTDYGDRRVLGCGLVGPRLRGRGRGRGRRQGPCASVGWSLDRLADVSEREGGFRLTSTTVVDRML